jgi:hypothetical protein
VADGSHCGELTFALAGEAHGVHDGELVPAAEHGLARTVTAR